MPDNGYRVVVTYYKYCHTLEEAKREAYKARGEGKRSEIIDEYNYNTNPAFHTPMQNLEEL